ncbi:MAG: hypothetical protein CM15mV124_530 [uncultured marine virus]|nr:MAG: hypothetical protein CM15mV124_530 [uncultured marine virus]
MQQYQPQPYIRYCCISLRQAIDPTVPTFKSYFAFNINGVFNSTEHYLDSLLIRRLTLLNNCFPSSPKVVVMLDRLNLKEPSITKVRACAI